MSTKTNINNEDLGYFMDALFGNRPRKEYTSGSLAVNKNDVVWHRASNKRISIYNVKESGTITSLNDSKLQKWEGLPSGGEGGSSGESILSFAKKLYTGLSTTR